jgi:DNA mismatch repair protein MutS2
MIEESKEIERILKEFTLKVSNDVDKIRGSFEIIIQLDAIFAKAIYANHTKAVKPNINDKAYIDIKSGRHPLIDKDKVVPNSIHVGKDFDMLFVTGPNTGGKTVTLKLVGLCVLMALSGLYVPANEADIGIFDNIFCDIGDEQSIEQNLSTFSSHINNIKHIIDALTPSSLVLLDELGAGTDPAEGASLALSIADYIKNSKAKAIITTHYNELKEYAMVNEGMQNASMEFNPETYSPTYKLTIGVPGASNALLIAQKLGLKQEIIESAKKGIKAKDIEFEKVLAQLNAAKREAEDKALIAEELKKQAQSLKKEAEIERERLRVQRERLNLSVRKETKRLVEKSMEEANEIIAALKEILDNPSEQNLFKAYELRKKLGKFIINDENEYEIVSQTIEGEIKVGDIVLVKSLNAQGEVRAINPIKNEAHVLIGSMSSVIKLDNLVKVKSPKRNKPKPQKTDIQLRNETVSPEINIIGMTTDEVDITLENFLESAYSGGLKEIRIIHGIGEGKLRKAVQRYLSKHKIVESYRDGKYGEGGRGVTVVSIK